MPISEFGDIGTRAAAYAHMNALEHARPVLVLEKFAQIRSMPRNKTMVIKFRRPTPFAAVTTPLTEGVTPDGAKMAYEDVPGTLAQYGDVHSITDWVADTAEDPVLKDITMLVGEQAAETKELLTWGVLVAGTNVFYAGAVASRNLVDAIFAPGRQKVILRALKAQRAKKLTSIQNGSVKVGTKPIQAAYIGICHTDVESDIRNAIGFVPCSEYGTREMICPEEFGAIGEVRYIANPILTNFPDGGALAATNNTITTTGTQADVYPIIYLGKEAFGCVPLAGKESIKISVLNPEKVSKSDVLGQRGYVGFKMWFLALILNELWMARLEVAVTDDDTLS